MSGVAEVPLGELIDPAPVRRAGASQYPILSMTMQHGLVDQERKFKKRVASEDLAAYRVVERGQLVVGFPIDEGVLAFQDSYAEAVVSPAYGVWNLRPGTAVHIPYLGMFLKSPRALGYYRAKLRGSTARRRSLPKELFLQLPVPLPTVEEQRRIAAVLDAADELRAKRSEAIATLDTLTQAIFIDMFGDPVTNPRGWTTAPLTELGTLDRGVSKHRPRNDPALLGGPWPLIQTGDVASSGGYIRAAGGSYSDLGRAQSRLWPAGTLCITIAANIAKTGILTFDACFPDSVVGFRSDPATTEFVRAFLGFLQPVLEANAPESAQKNINLKTLRTVEVPLPPSALREQFAQAVNDVRAQHARLTGSGEGFDELTASLQQRALRGEL